MSNSDTNPNGLIERSKVSALLKKALSDQQAKHELELRELRKLLEQETDAKTYNNRPRQKRTALWQQQLAVLQTAAANRELKTWGQNAVGNHLRDKGIGCNNRTASDLVAMLVTDGYLERMPNGKVSYKDEDGRAAA